MKSNLSAPPDALGYHITEDGYFTWDGVVELEADLLLSPQQDDPSARADAKDFLKGLLAEEEVPAK